MGVGAEGVQDESGQPGGEHGVAVGDPVHGIEQAFGADGLGEVAVGPGADDGDDVLGGIGDGQGQPPGSGRAVARQR